MDPMKGWCLRTLMAIPKDAFVMEYVAERISEVLGSESRAWAGVMGGGMRMGRGHEHGACARAGSMGMGHVHGVFGMVHRHGAWCMGMGMRAWAWACDACGGHRLRGRSVCGSA